MKILNILTLVLAALVSYTAAQTCPGSPRNPACIRSMREVGHTGPGCTARMMWYFDSRVQRCRQMRYLGCGGGNNRWCTRAACRQRCGGS